MIGWEEMIRQMKKGERFFIAVYRFSMNTRNDGFGGEAKDSLVPGKSEVEEWLSERSRMIASDSAKETNKRFSDIEGNHNGNIFFSQRLVYEAGVEFKIVREHVLIMRFPFFCFFPDFHS